MHRFLLRRPGRTGGTARRGILAIATLSAAVLLTASPAQAARPPVVPPDVLPPPTAALTEVTDFGANPTALQMFLYVPNQVRPHPAVVMVLHYCTGTGPAMFTGSQWASLADLYGFLVVFPSATRDGHCFDVSSPGSLTHNGNNDPVGLVSMVKHVIRTEHADRNRVFVTGWSSGAMMTNVLLADYPDVFAAGSAVMGVPFSCFATPDGSLWNTTCAHGEIVKTAPEWGSLARGAFPGFHGKRPRMQLWHGTADTILFYPNFGEEIKQWTNVLGAATTPARTEQPKPTWTHTTYTDCFGQVVVDAYSVEGESHNLPFNQTGVAQRAVAFFGLTGHH